MDGCLGERLFAPEHAQPQALQDVAASKPSLNLKSWRCEGRSNQASPRHTPLEPRPSQGALWEV